MRSVYLQANARLLLQSLPLGEVKYLSPSEIELMAESLSRPSSIARGLGILGRPRRARAVSIRKSPLLRDGVR